MCTYYVHAKVVVPGNKTKQNVFLNLQEINYMHFCLTIRLSFSHLKAPRQEQTPPQSSETTLSAKSKIAHDDPPKKNMFLWTRDVPKNKQLGWTCKFVQKLRYLNTNFSDCINVTLFGSIAVFCGTNNFVQNISHIQLK